MSQASSIYSLPEPIDRKLHSVKRRMKGVGLATAAVGAVAVLLAAMLLAMLIDYLATLYDSGWRSVLTLSAMGAATASLAGWAVLAWRRSSRTVDVAREVDRRVPYLEERWSTVAHFAESGAREDGAVNEAMYRQVAAEAARADAHVDAGSVVSMSGVVKAFLALNAVTLVLVIAAVADWQRTSVLMRRFWSPGANISATRFQTEPGDTVVGRGEPLLVSASLSGPEVGEATLLLRGAQTDEDRILLIPRGEEQLSVTHRFRSVEDSFAYRLRGGDGQTDWYEVTVADRPEIKAARIEVTPPEYRKEETKSVDKLPRQVSVVEGSHFSIAILPAAELKSLELQTGLGEPVTLTPDADGWYRWESDLNESLKLTPVLTEPHGLTLRRPPTTRVHVYPDRPPVVKIISPDDHVAVTPDDTIQVEFVAEDDNGIGAAELVVTQEPLDGESEPVVLETIPIDLGDDIGQKKVRGSAELDLSDYPLVDGSSLSYSVRVTEQRSPGQPAGALADAATNANSLTTTTPSAGGQQPGEQPLVQDTASEAEGDAQAPTETALASNQATQPQAGDGQPSPSSNGGSGQSTPSSNSTNSSPDASAMASAANGSGAESTTQEATEEATGEPSQTPDAETVAKDDQQPGESEDEASRVADSGEKKDDDSQGSGFRMPGFGLPGGLPMPSALAAAPRSSAGSGEQSDQTNPASAGQTSGQSAPGQPGQSPSPTSQASGAQSGSPSPADSQSDGQPNDKQSGDTELADNSGAGSDNEATAEGEAPASPNRTAESQSRSIVTSTPGESPGEMNDPENTPDESQIAESTPSSEAGDGTQQPGQQQPGSDQMASNQSNAGRNNAGQNNTGQNNTGQPSQNRPSADANQQQGRAMANSGQPGANQSNSNQPSGGGSQSSPQGSQMANQDQNSSPSGDRPPSGRMPTQRQLDIGAQSASSNQMRVSVDQYAGSFEGQQRAKLEMAVAPELDAIERLLVRGQKLTRAVLDELAEGKGWQARHHRDVNSADETLKEAQVVARKLQGRTHNTPYAFIGLQVSDISSANITPAREYLFQSLQQKDEQRTEMIRLGWQQIGQALDRFAALEQKFESTRRENALADATERVNKMYRVFIEDTFARPFGGGDDGGSPFSRKMAEFDVDEEYLERLREVLEMRRDLRAELAKILAEDPRLLRRFMNNFRDTRLNLRNQLVEMREDQEELNTETRFWAGADEAKRESALPVVARRRLEEGEFLAADAGELASRFEAWMPLEEPTPELTAALDEANALAADAREMALEAKRLGSKSTTPDELKPVEQSSRALYDRLRAFEVSLRGLGAADSLEGEVDFVINRLAETRRLVTATSSWNRRIRELSEGNFHRAAAVEQYEMATATDELAGKLSDVESQIATLLGTQDGTLPPSIAMHARALLKTLDERVTPNQMASAIALERKLWERVQQRQEAAAEALADAEEQFDEMIKAAIAELDQLPVQDPIAQLLQDPTLDDILRQLEQETPLEEALGIPRRRSNLQTINDWLSPNRADGGMSSGGARMMSRQMRQQQRRMERAARRAQAAALRRIKESQKVVRTTPERKEEEQKPRTADWNKLVSELDNDLLQGRDKLPPERYRAAIEQYRTLMNKIASEEADRQ